MNTHITVGRMVAVAAVVGGVAVLMGAAAGEAGGKRCVGIATTADGSKLFRAFEDGSVEVTSLSGTLAVSWKPIETQSAAKASASNTTTSAKEIRLAASMVSNAGPFSMAIDTFRLDMGRYPKALDELFQAPANDEEAKKWNGPYVKSKASLNDPWGHEIQYRSPGKVNENSYDLWSMGPNGKSGDEDDITNYAK